MNPMIDILDKFEKLKEEINSFKISKAKKDSTLTLIDEITISFRNVNGQLFITNSLVKKFYSKLEKLQKDLYDPDTKEKREVFKYAEMLYEKSLKSVKCKDGIYRRKRKKLIDVLWDACLMYPKAKKISPIIKYDGKEGVLYLEFYETYLKWRSNKKKQLKQSK